MRRTFVALISAAAIGAVGLPSQASAAPPDPFPSAPVTGQMVAFDGEQLDLSKGWGNAKSCVEFSRGHAACYGTHQEADAVLGYSRATDLESSKAAAALPACASGWLCLYEHNNGGGRRLIFSDEYWHNLAEWGFQCKTSSWRNRQGSGDSGGLSGYFGTCGSGNAWSFTLSAQAYASQLGIYNDGAFQVRG